MKPFGIDAASKRSTGPFDANGVREGLFTDESRSTRLAAAEPLAPPNKQTQRTARLLPGYRVQAIPQPAVPGEHRFTIRLSRGQPQTNLGGALIGHIRRSGGAHDPDGNFHPVTEFGPAEFDEIVTFLRKTEQQGPPDLVDTWKFIDLPPGWRSEVEATATWSYVDKLTRPDAEKLGFKLNPWSGNMWSTDKPVDWSATNFGISERTHPISRRIPAK